MEVVPNAGNQKGVIDLHFSNLKHELELSRSDLERARYRLVSRYLKILEEANQQKLSPKEEEKLIRVVDRVFGSFPIEVEIQDSDSLNKIEKIEIDLLVKETTRFLNSELNLDLDLFDLLPVNSSGSAMEDLNHEDIEIYSDDPSEIRISPEFTVDEWGHVLYGEWRFALMPRERMMLMLDYFSLVGEAIDMHYLTVAFTQLNRGNTPVLLLNLYQTRTEDSELLGDDLKDQVLIGEWDPNEKRFFNPNLEIE